MSQRGISSDMVDMALDFGEDHPKKTDRVVLGRRRAVELIAEKQRQVKAYERALSEEKRELRLLKKLADKGGIVVVSTNATLVTTYNLGA